MSISKRFWGRIKRFGSLGSTARSRLQREFAKRLRPSRRRLLRLESLESRHVFATASLSDGMLSIDLNQTDEVAYLTNDGTSLRLASSHLASELSFSTAAVSSIQVTDTTLRTGQSFSLSYGLPLSLSGSMSVSQIETVVFGSDLIVSGASGLSVTSSQSIQVRAPLSTTGDPIVFNARDGITITYPVVSDGGNQTLDADEDADGVGTLTLDFPVKDFTDPNPNSGNGFGTSVLVLPSGNVAITSPNDDFGGSNAGAVYLFNGMTGSLISTLRGSSASDQIGSTGLVQLTNGNYVVRSALWDSGSVADVGAVTWGSGVLGVSGAVSSSNSLVGSTLNDNVGFNGVTALTNGNYVVRGTSWDSGAIANVGAVTWGSGVLGVSGVVSSSNSLVGSSLNDNVGGNGIAALTNGNYFLVSANWDSGAVSDVGAVTWGNGTSGVSGVVSSSNSLVGSSTSDQVGLTGVTALTNGNYVVRSSSWDFGGLVNVGAVTWGNGTSGLSGVVSSSNSLVGSKLSDNVGNTGITALTNGNYVVRSSNWDSEAITNVGAVTWGNGTSGISGSVSSSNSLVGSTASDGVGSTGITELTNGNYVIRSSAWDSGATVDVGAVTWGNGTSGVFGVVSSSNSLVGSSASDNIGGTGVTALTNGNYVVRSTSWDSAGVTNVGAVTWGNGTSGRTGSVSSSNSLVGSALDDNVGGTGVTALTNGNYVVVSTGWDRGGIGNVGAVTWGNGNGTSGISGVVSSSNSLVGSANNHFVGNSGVTALTNGNYVVRSSSWSSGGISGVGAVTWGNGTSGRTGSVSSSNSLVGSSASDNVGGTGVTALTNGNYVVRSSNWDSGAITNVGAVTWGNGTSGRTGSVSSSNSLVGSAVNDYVGGTGVTALTNGNYVVRSSNWDSGTIVDVGAVTWGSGLLGVSGLVSSSNSLVGSSASDSVGSTGLTELTNGNYAVRSSSWDSGTLGDVGAVTWGNGTSALSGVVSSSNSIVGQTANQGASWSITTASTLDAFLATNPSDGSGRVVLGSSARGFSLPSTPAGSLQAANGSVSLGVAGTNLQGTISSNAEVTIAPSQTARQIDLGSKSSGKLGLTDTELDWIAAATLRIGSPTSGDLTISSPISRPTSTAMQLTSGGAILFGSGAQSTGGAIHTAGGTLTLDAGTTVRPVTPGVDANTSALSFAAGDTVQIDINGATVDSQYSQLSVVGPVTLTGVTLSLNVNFPAMAGTETFTILNTTGGVTGQFSGLIQGGAISVGSFAYTANYTANSVELVPAIAPAITQSPSSQTVVSGNTATFTAAASGTPTPTVKWQVSTNGGVDWADISGATSTTLSFTAAAGDNAKQYRAIFTNAVGSDATTSAATLTVNVPPAITSRNSATFAAGLTESFQVVATGNPAVTFSITSGSLPSGVTLNPTTGVLSGKAASLGTAGAYPVTIRASNGIGTAATQAFTLTVVSDINSIQVSRGQAQRSYLRYIDLAMSGNSAATQLSSNSSTRMKLFKSDLNGNSPAEMSLAGFVSASGSTVTIDFGAQGIGGSRNTSQADGYYALKLDLNGDGTFETTYNLYRLFGDTNGDGKVDQTDVNNVTAGMVAYSVLSDLNADGRVNSTDLLYVRRALNRSLNPSLPLG